jgi:MFS family permease
MQDSAPTPVADPCAEAAGADTRRIIGYVYFTFICYLSISLPLAVLPPYVHLRMGFSAALAGLVVSIQYIATLASRPWAGRISDRMGAKVSVLAGMAACTLSGALLVAAALLHGLPWLSVSTLVASRLVLGVGESLGSTGATLWGITAAGHENMAKVISYNGISTYGAMAIGAPLGVILDQQWGLASIGFITVVIGAVSYFIAANKCPIKVEPGEHLPFKHIMFRVAPHGMGLALGGVGYTVLATFVTLFYASHHWNGAALCLTGFGLSFILVRLLFIHTIDRFGGYPVAKFCLLVDAAAMVILWRAQSPWIALAGASLTGAGFALVFPALGVEAVKRVEESNRGTALGVFTAFADVSFFLTGPIAGLAISFFGYASVFVFALISILAALGIVAVLAMRDPQPEG